MNKMVSWQEVGPSQGEVDCNQREVWNYQGELGNHQGEIGQKIVESFRVRGVQVQADHNSILKKMLAKIMI